MAQINR
jgi:hypothetical protein